MRGATLFSGGGGAEALLKDRIDFVHAVEYDPAIAAVYRQNHGNYIHVADVCEVDYSVWGALDYLHASPVCKNASQAKTGGVESDTDMQTALAVVRCLEATQPRVFTLENVGGYQRFKAYRLICEALGRAGYMWHAEVLNAADYAVPQTRRRLILRAVRDALLPGLPAPLPWVGWYAAIEDLLPTLPESRFADWQLKRLPEHINGNTFFNNNAETDNYTTLNRRDEGEPVSTVVSSSSSLMSYRAFIVHANDQRSMPVRDAADPMFTVAAGSHASHAPDVRLMAFVISGGNSSSAEPHYQDEPYITVVSSPKENQYARAFLVPDQNTGNGRGGWVCEAESPSMTLGSTARAWLSHGRVVKMTPRALARFQSLPDSYILPEKVGLACTIIGNMVPSLLMREVVTPLL